MKKICTLTSLLSCTVGLMITGCASGSTDTSGSGSGGIVVINYWNRQAELLPALNPVISDFQKEHPNIEIKVSTASSDQYPTQLQAAISGNDLPDIFAAHGSVPITQMTQLGLVHDLSDLITKDHKANFTMGPGRQDRP